MPDSFSSGPHINGWISGGCVDGQMCMWVACAYLLALMYCCTLKVLQCDSEACCWDSGPRSDYQQRRIFFFLLAKIPSTKLPHQSQKKITPPCLEINSGQPLSPVTVLNFCIFFLPTHHCFPWSLYSKTLLFPFIPIFIAVLPFSQ